jgi:hypothetical protein
MNIDKRYQQLLFDLSLYQGYIDGVYGSVTEAAVKKFQTMNGLKADGIVGPKTREAFEIHLSSNVERNTESTTINHDHTRWPQESQQELFRFYGNVGENQVRIDAPYKMVLAWDLNTTITRITCHTKVADSLYTILDNVRRSYTETEITRHGFNLFGGTLNVRQIRGGTRWSTHAWGVAIDIDPARNGLRTPWHQAYLGRPECRDFVECFKQQGWYSLGLEKNFDAMHFQACWR